MTKQFEVGHTYDACSVGDSDCWTQITIAKRTAKTVTLTSGKTLRPYVWEGVEHVRPNGSYSMCLIVGADDEGRKARVAQRDEAGRMMREAHLKAVRTRISGGAASNDNQGN